MGSKQSRARYRGKEHGRTGSVPPVLPTIENGGQWKYWPPLIVSVDPVMNPASSATR